jgi:hypothetical protein
MIRFLSGVVVGIVIATVGLSGLATLADAQVEKFKTSLKENSK